MAAMTNVKVQLDTSSIQGFSSLSGPS